MVKLVHNVQKKQHRERSQPQNRKRWGLLEKKKDYKLRAENFHKKQAQLKILKSKVKSRNEDEYYHAMTTKKTDKNGILIADRGNETLSNDEVLLLKSQDSNYLTTIRQQEQKKIEKEINNMNVFQSNGKHTVFVGSNEEMEEFDPAEFFNTDASLLDRRENRLRISQLQGKSISNNDDDGESINDQQIVAEFEDSSEGYRRAKLDLQKQKKLKLLEQRLEREKKLKKLQSKMELQKQLMKKGEKKKIETKTGATVFKWKNQRKR
ncbi:hypothetical protein CANARDRAFT_29443 [[Candida] arabinofermentans NRRL YB-2248]|uniref:U3 small nucleolar RNA-associated protein 11 n=1 Tax=[Candida] arabinofermentans NRRL YB-2248 TaxID=983967 RepID=A0A1E4SWU4_9ASCO|nr:hypothetical protein CANARDRAFT_29443 [[Candida] arabinofermentans NRRL YB-2248]